MTTPEHPSGFLHHTARVASHILSGSKVEPALHVFILPPNTKHQTFSSTWFLANYLKQNCALRPTLLLVSMTESYLKLHAEMVAKHIGTSVVFARDGSTNGIEAMTLGGHHYAVCLSINSEGSAIFQVHDIPDKVDISYMCNLCILDSATLNGIVNCTKTCAWTCTNIQYTRKDLGLNSSVLYNFRRY